VPVEAVAMRPGPGFSDLRAWLAIRRYIRKLGPFEIIHGHSSKGGALARLPIGAGNAARIYSPHAFVTMNPGMVPLRRAFYYVLEKFLAVLGDAVIATSPAEHEHARTVLGIPARKLFLVPNGIEPTAKEIGEGRGKLRQAWGVQDDEIIIGTVGRFVPQKAPEVLLQAFARVAQQQRNARLVMVGDGPLRKSLERKAAELGISQAVILPGYVDSPQVMAAFDLFVLSSRYEGFPYVLLEALAAGLPLVTTEVGGAEMTVEPGRNGFVVPVDDERTLADRLCRVLRNPDELVRMGAISSAKVREFSVSSMVEKTLDLYEALLDSRVK
jgi:glycosyltransferase involved in cell wall biosynthesis